MSHLLDPYVRIKQLGQGSFGRVILVRDGRDQQLYVMKEVDLQQFGAKGKKEALKECGFLNQLRHPYIIAYKEFFEKSPPGGAGGGVLVPLKSKDDIGESKSAADAQWDTGNKKMLFIIMEYADGGDLDAKIKRQKKVLNGTPFPESQILDWFVQIVLAIKHIHDRKILHRDIKAENIFLMQGSQQIKIGDFGISKHLSSTMAQAMTRIGTPYYLSPEIAMNKPYNQKSDIWSLGIVLYELCTLRHPFDATSMESLLKKIVKGHHAPISSKVYSAELRNLVDLLLQKDPRKRPSINELCQMSFLKPIIERFLPADLYADEFSHTIIHDYKPLPIPVGNEYNNYGSQHNQQPHLTAQRKKKQQQQQQNYSPGQGLPPPNQQQAPLHLPPAINPKHHGAGGGGGQPGGGGGGISHPYNLPPPGGARPIKKAADMPSHSNSANNHHHNNNPYSQQQQPLLPSPFRRFPEPLDPSYGQPPHSHPQPRKQRSNQHLIRGAAGPGGESSAVAAAHQALRQLERDRHHSQHHHHHPQHRDAYDHEDHIARMHADDAAAYYSSDTSDPDARARQKFREYESALALQHARERELEREKLKERELQRQIAAMKARVAAGGSGPAPGLQGSASYRANPSLLPPAGHVTEAARRRAAGVSVPGGVTTARHHADLLSHEEDYTDGSGGGAAGGEIDSEGVFHSYAARREVELAQREAELAAIRENYRVEKEARRAARLEQHEKTRNHILPIGRSGDANAAAGGGGGSMSTTGVPGADATVHASAYPSPQPGYGSRGSQGMSSGELLPRVSPYGSQVNSPSVHPSSIYDRGSGGGASGNGGSSSAFPNLKGSPPRSGTYQTAQVRRHPPPPSYDEAAAEEIYEEPTLNNHSSNHHQHHHGGNDDYNRTANTAYEEDFIDDEPPLVPPPQPKPKSFPAVPMRVSPPAKSSYSSYSSAARNPYESLSAGGGGGGSKYYALNKPTGSHASHNPHYNIPPPSHLGSMGHSNSKNRGGIPATKPKKQYHLNNPNVNSANNRGGGGWK